MKKLISISLLVCWTAVAAAAKLDTVAVFSAKMQLEIKAFVVVPEHNAGEKLPTLYLLHGYNGNESSWQRISDLRPLSERYGMIVVCPDGENSWYWDSPTDPRSQFETFVAQELPDWIESRYDAIPSRDGRAIAGLSMGGHGAMWVALHHKDRFGAVGTTSGGIDIRPFPRSWHMKDQLGERDANPARWDAHTVMTAVDSLRNGELAIIMDCGYDDLFYGVNLKLHEKLLDKKIDHDFLVRPGGHNEAYWAVSLPYQLLFFQRWFDAHRR